MLVSLRSTATAAPALAGQKSAPRAWFGQLQASCGRANGKIQQLPKHIGKKKSIYASGTDASAAPPQNDSLEQFLFDAKKEFRVKNGWLPMSSK